MFDYRVIFVAQKVRVRTFAAAAVAAGALLALAGPAQAQFFGWWGSPPPPSAAPQNAAMPPGEIYSMVAARGYMVTGSPQRNGRVYLVNVTDEWGRPQRLVVDAYQGEILQRFETAPPRPAASIPQRRPSEIYPQYPNYPGAGSPSVNVQPQAVPVKERKAEARSHRGRVNEKKTQTAARETGAPAAEPARPSHARHTTARTEAPQRASADVAPQPAAKVEPAAAAAAPAAPKPAPKTTGPGYANGVPINPLD